MSCDFQTNSGVEVALMLQTGVTSARSSWETCRRLVEQERYLAAAQGSGQREEQRTTAAAGDFFFFFKATN